MDSIIIGQKAVAEVFEVSERTVRNWIAAGVPRLSKRRFDRGQIQAWLDRRDEWRKVAELAFIGGLKETADSLPLVPDGRGAPCP